MTIRYETRAAIAALPGKTLRPWKDGDARCHCTHCALCGEAYRTEDIAQHEDECQAALLEALETVVDIGELTPAGLVLGPESRPSAYSVECPRCGAAAGHQCRSDTGYHTARVHVERAELAGKNGSFRS